MTCYLRFFLSYSSCFMFILFLAHVSFIQMILDWHHTCLSCHCSVQVDVTLYGRDQGIEMVSNVSAPASVT